MSQMSVEFSADWLIAHSASENFGVQLKSLGVYVDYDSSEREDMRCGGGQRHGIYLKHQLNSEPLISA